ncbi:TPR-like protein [Mytilinidion resinicola]|uniref:TPR-like protein n=1 Tax=Mytilinidion resinicola TaxID=574789 RepID=A0A6A6Z7B0_9PEZI|nr:TPR-like protein [Mytilinidion resinicola]KAF2816920.1 TPR-like protein [Mytilinidion resinicola]
MSDASTDRSEVRFPCHLMPFGRNRSFFGRKKELTDIENALCPARPEEGPEEYSLLRTFAITGAGGMGKSQLATEFVCNNKSLFDAVFWVHADEQSKLSEDFSSIALALGLVGQDSPEATDHVLTRERVKMWLAHPLKGQSTKNRRDSRRDSNEEGPLASWLLVYDGADRPELLNVFWPLGGSGSILITSRDPLPWTASLDLKPFSPEDGAGFLLKTTKRGASKEDEEDAITISKRLGGLPLALTQMARFITNSNLTFSDFIRAYNEREKKEAMFKFQVDGPNAQANYGHNLASVWALENLREGKALLDVISMLDPDSIPEHILTSFADTVNLKEYPKSIKAYSVARTELIQSSIVGGNARTQTLFIHRLVQDVARLRMSRSQYRETFDAAVRLISSVWPYQPFTWRHSISRWSKCADLYPHIIRLRELSKPFSPDPDNVAGDFEYAKLLMDAGCMPQVLAPRAGGRNVISEQEVDAVLAELHHNRGCIATETNCPKDALRHHGIFNTMMLKEFEGRPPGIDWRLGISWNQLGTAKMINELWEEGEDCFRRAILAMHKVDNFKQVWISLPVVNLGQAYWLTNRCEKALIILTEGLSYRQAHFGMDDKESFITGRFFHAIGNVKATQGHMEESLDFHRKALLHYKNTLGNNHHRTADICIKVAEHCIRKDQIDTALTLLDQALRAYGDREAYKPEKARAHFKRAKTLRLLGRKDEAEDELQTSWKLYQEIRPKDTRPVRDLIDDDFDKTVVFWSR